MCRHLSIGIALFLIVAATYGCGDDNDGTGGGAPPTQVPTATTQPTQPGSTVTPTAPVASSPTPTSTPESGETPTPPEPGEGSIVFAANVDDFLSDVLVIRIDGTGRTNLTNTNDASESQPSWSPDGGKILYRIGDDMLAVMNADGSGKAVVLDSDGPVYYPSWSPDGSQIVFVGDESIQTQGDNTIDGIDADGTDRRTILATKGDYLSPTYSPDGGRIAYISKVNDVLQILVMNADGSEIEQITEGEAQNEGSAWRPAGDDIAFNSTGGIHLIRSDGTDRRLVIESSGRNVAWKRDGTLLAFDVFSQGIMVVEPDGSNLQLVPNTSDGFDPDVD